VFTDPAELRRRGREHDPGRQHDPKRHNDEAAVGLEVEPELGSALGGAGAQPVVVPGVTVGHATAGGGRHKKPQSSASRRAER
jgi:hypothetical protein